MSDAQKSETIRSFNSNPATQEEISKAESSTNKKSGKQTDAQESEKIREKIRNFISNPATQEEFAKVKSAINKKCRFQLGSYHDKDRHSALQIFLECAERIISGQRHWDYRSVKIQAILINAARSITGSELEKEIEGRGKMDIHLEKPRKANGEEYLTQEELLDYYNTDDEAYRSELNTYCDKEIIRMAQRILKNDKVALKVMKQLREYDSNIEISERLEITVRDVENARKRIRRAGERLLQKISRKNHCSIEEIRAEILRRE